MGFSETTKKYLLAASGNKCAFPGCDELIFDLELESYIGEICHIKGNKHGSARFDPDQPDEERQSYHNGIVMCRNHGTVIDKSLKVENYTVALLKRWKKEHESRTSNTQNKRWIVPPNSIFNGNVLLKTGKLAVHFWIDRNGTPQIYSDEKLGIINVLMALNLIISDASKLVRSLKTNPEVKSKDFLHKSYGKIISEDRTLAENLYQTMLEAPNIMFVDFIQFLAPGQDLTRALEEAIERRDARNGFWK